MPLTKPTKPAAIDPVPTPVPQRSDRVNFAPRGDATMTALPGVVSGMNTNVDYVADAADYVEEQVAIVETASDLAVAAAASATSSAEVNGTSTTTRTPALGSMTWTYVQTNRVPAVGMRMRAVSRAAPTTNYAIGAVTAWDGTSIVTLNVDGIGAAPASASDWNLILEGEPGGGLEETTFVDKGTVSSGTATFTLGIGDRMQRIQAGGNITLAVSGWPASGRLGELLIEAVNFGAHTITWPTVNWIKADGTTTTTFSSNGVTMQTSGTDFVLLWTRNGGTTVYGKVMR